jgi:coatomer protein complex subunit gamma
MLSFLSVVISHQFKAIVDRNPLVASSALVSGLHYMKENPDLVRRWVNEVQQAVQSDEHMVQFHALALLYSIKQHDRQAISKVVVGCPHLLQHSIPCVVF